METKCPYCKMKQNKSSLVSKYVCIHCGKEWVKK